MVCLDPAAILKVFLNGSNVPQIERHASNPFLALRLQLSTSGVPVSQATRHSDAQDSSVGSSEVDIDHETIDLEGPKASVPVPANRLLPRLMTDFKRPVNSQPVPPAPSSPRLGQLVKRGIKDVAVNLITRTSRVAGLAILIASVNLIILSLEIWARGLRVPWSTHIVLCVLKDCRTLWDVEIELGLLAGVFQTQKEQHAEEMVQLDAVTNHQRMFRGSLSCDLESFEVLHCRHDCSDTLRTKKATSSEETGPDRMALFKCIPLGVLMVLSSMCFAMLSSRNIHPEIMGYILHTISDSDSVKQPTNQPNVQFNTTTTSSEQNANLNSEDSIHEIIRDARTWALALLLPRENFANDDQFIHEVDDLRQLWLGTVDCATFHAVLWNIAHRLLYRGLGQPDHPPSGTKLNQDYIIRISDDETTPESALRFYKVKYPELFQTSDNIRTWAELKSAAKVIDSKRPDEPFSLAKTVLVDQETTTRRRLGLLTWTIDDNFQNELQHELQGKSGNDIDDIAQKHDLSKKFAIVAVCRPEEPGRPTLGANMSIDNVMSLYPYFFHSCSNELITGFNLDLLPIRNTQARQAVVIHELTHSRSSITTTDTKKRPSDLGRSLTREELDTDARLLAESPRIEKGYYGLDRCMELVAWDKEHGTRYAEGNADNWSLLCNHYILHLVYPEFSFNPGLQIESKTDGARNWYLRHHSSLLDVLRHPRTGLIRNLPYYDKTKDPYWSEAAGWSKVPQTKEDLLKLLIEKTSSRTVQPQIARNKTWAQLIGGS